MATTDQKDLSIQMVHIDDQKDVHQLYPKTKDKNVTIESTNKALPTGITTLKDVVDKLGDSAFSSSTVIGITADERNKLKGIEAGAQVNMVDGVKGDAETYYRTGDVNITKANIGLGSVENKSSATIRSEITSLNVTSALGYTPPKQDTTYADATTTNHGLMSTDDKIKLDGIAPGAQVNSITGVKGDSESTYRTGNVNITKANVGLGNVENKSSATIRGELTSANVTSALGYTPPRVNTTYEPATTDTDGLLSSDDKTKLDSIEAGAQKNTVTGVKGYNESAYRTGAIVITKDNVGLGNVENKSSATIRGELTSSNVTTALGYTPPKQDTTYPPADGSTLGLIKTGGGLTLTNGVATVNNNSHSHTIANITNLQASLDSKLNTSLKGAKNGLATLDENGFVPSSQLPSYVDDVVEVNMGSDLASATLADDSPVTPETGKIYVDLTSNKTYRWSGTAFVVISETLALGETSSTAFDGARGKVAYNHSQSAHARTDATLTQSSTTNGNIKINGTETKVYTHPSYTAQKSGLYKVTVDASGHVSAVTAVTKADITALGIPGQDTNTTYDVATTSTNGLLSSTDKAKLDGIAFGANKYTHPGYTSRTSGLYKITVDSMGHVSAVASVTKSDITALGIPGQDTTYGTMTGATANADGAKGLVPAPAKGDSSRYLRSDGTWVTPPNTTYGDATTSTHGLMSATDKAKLDGVASGANRYVHPSYTAYDSGFYKVSVDSTGHVAAAVAVSKSDITSLGIPGQDTTYNDATTSAHGLMTAAMVSKLNGIASGANKYTHPSYTSHASGLYKVTVDGTGHVSAVASVTKADLTALGIPSSNTTYGTMTGATSDTDGSTGLVPAPTKGAATRYLRSDGTWVTPPNTTYGMVSSTSNGLMSSTDKAKLDGIASGANKYTHPGYTSRTSGLYKITVDSMGHVSAVASVTKADITALGIPGQDTNTTYGVMGGATSSANGSTGLVPAPVKGDSSRYLRSDGTWVTPPNTTYNDATTSTHGLMSSTDKAKLDGIASGAQVNSVTSVAGRTGAVTLSKSDVGLGNVDNTADSAKSVKYAATAGSASSVSWGNVSGKPSTFTPSSHTHNSIDIINLNGTDLNTLKDNTFKSYYAGGGNTNTNKPSGVNAFGMMSYRNASGCYAQELYGSNGAKYIRVYDGTNSVWTGWERIYTTSYKPSKSDVGLGSVDNTADSAKSVKYATTAGSANSVAWGNVSGKPSTYAPSTHTHTIAQVTNLQSSLDGKAAKSHTHAISDISNLQNTLSYVDNRINGMHYNSITISGANTANYPYHRFLSIQNVSTKWYDGTGIYLIDKKWDGGTYGIVKVTLRVNGEISSYSVAAKWLVRSSSQVPEDIVFGAYLHDGKLDVDVFLKCGKHPRTYVYNVLGVSNWTMISSNEVENTTTSDRLKSVECYSSLADAGTRIHSATYSRTGNASDEGKVLNANYATTAGSANSVAWGNISGKPSTYYTHPGYTAHSSGLYKVTVDGSGHVSAVSNVTKSDITSLGIPGQDTTYGTMTGATANANGAKGLVPAPAKGDSSRYLRSDGTWVTPPNTTYGDATTSAHGLMTAAMVSKLNGIASGANKYTHPGYTAHSSGLYKVTVDGSGHVSAVSNVTKSDITALGIPGADTNTWRGIQDNLTSSATDQSLSANQGRILKSLVDGKAAASHTHAYIPTSVNYVLITDETNLTAYDATAAKWNAPS